MPRRQIPPSPIVKTAIPKAWTKTQKHEETILLPSAFARGKDTDKAEKRKDLPHTWQSNDSSASYARENKILPVREYLPPHKAEKPYASIQAEAAKVRKIKL